MTVADGSLSSARYGRVSSRSRLISISRPVYDQASFDHEFVVDRRPSTSLRDRLLPSCDRSTPVSICRRLVRYFPVVQHLRNYRWKSWLFRDIMAGISSGVIHVPQGMGFALLAGVPPVYGLYTSIFPGWIYYLFGTSRHLSVGSMALTALMVGAVVARVVPDSNTDVGPVTETVTSLVSTATIPTLTSQDVTSSYGHVTSPASAADDAAMKVGVAVSVTLIAGLFQLAMRVCQLGVICSFMSMPFIVSFLTASSSQIIIAQIPFELGLTIKRPQGYFVLVRTIIEIIRHIKETNICALVVSVISIAFLITIKEYVNERFKKKLKLPIPAELLLVIIVTIVSYFGRLNERFALPIIYRIPLGFPTPRVPPMTAAGGYVADGLVTGIVGFVVAVTMARLMAERNFYEVDNDQELLACSLYNIFGSFFGCFVATQAPPRTLVHETAGGRSQLAGGLSTLVPLLVVLALGPLFEALPICVLGCITTCAILPLMKQFTQLRSLWRISWFDFLAWIVTYVCTAFIDIAVGLAVGVAFACLLAVVQTKRLRSRRLTRAVNTEIYYYSRGTRSATLPAGVVVYRVGGPLFYANVDTFVEQLYSDVQRPTDSKEQVLVSLSVSDDRQDFLGDAAKATTTSDGVEMTNVAEAGDTTSNRAHETVDANDNSEEDASRIQQQDSTSVRVIVLDCSRVAFIDSTAVAVLKKVYSAYRMVGVQVVFSGCDAKVKVVMDAADVHGNVPGQIALYPTVHDAVIAVS